MISIDVVQIHVISMLGIWPTGIKLSKKSYLKIKNKHKS